MRCLAALALVALLGGCDRARVDPGGVTLLAADPDLSTVRLDPKLDLRLTPAGIGGRIDVAVNGETLPFDSTEGAFVLRTTLGVGLNPFRLAVTDDEGTVRRDTLFAVHLPLRPVSLVAPQVSVARVGAAAVVVANGQIAVTGGADETGRALASVTLLDPSGSRIGERSAPLLAPRAGHTASVLASGQVLLLGGATAARPSGPGDFVRTAELLDPNGLTSALIGVDGDVARAGHTAHVLNDGQDTYVYLFGGRVPAGSGTVVTGTVDVYRLEATPELKLVRISPPGGAGAFARLADHVQAPLGPRRAAVLGRTSEGDPAAVLFEWFVPGTTVFPFEMRSRALPEAAVGRTGAAAVDLSAVTQGDRLALLLGGEGEDGPLGTMEVVAPDIGRRFPVPHEVGLAVPRSGHTATILPGGRIVVSGGRSASGTALLTLEAFQL